MPKRYYKKCVRLPEGIDRLETEVRHPITEEQITDWLNVYFRRGDMKSTVGYIILKHELWEEAMNIGRHGNPQMAFRATWALEWAYEQSEERPEWFFDRMIDDFWKSNNGSIHRVYAKMLYDQIRFEGVQPNDVMSERLSEKCFDLLIDPKTRSAVQFWCLEILTELLPRAEWMADTLEDLVFKILHEPDCSSWMSVNCHKILKTLNTIKAAK